MNESQFNQPPDASVTTTSTASLFPPSPEQTTQDITWFHGTYYQTLDTAIGTAYSYMNTTINWAISLLTAVIIFLVTRTTFPDELTWYVLCACLVLVAHFASRTAKGYLNVIRWAAIQRTILCDKLTTTKHDPPDAATLSTVHHYHINWNSPIKFSDLLYKLLIELGFAHLAILVLALLMYTSLYLPPSIRVIAGLVIAIILVAMEVILLRTSPYLRKIQVDASSQNLR